MFYMTEEVSHNDYIGFFKEQVTQFVKKTNVSATNKLALSKWIDLYDPRAIEDGFSTKSVLNYLQDNIMLRVRPRRRTQTQKERVVEAWVDIEDSIVDAGQYTVGTLVIKIQTPDISSDVLDISNYRRGILKLTPHYRMDRKDEYTEIANRAWLNAVDTQISSSTNSLRYTAGHIEKDVSGATTRFQSELDKFHSFMRSVNLLNPVEEDDDGTGESIYAHQTVETIFSRLDDIQSDMYRTGFETLLNQVKEGIDTASDLPTTIKLSDLGLRIEERDVTDEDEHRSYMDEVLENIAERETGERPVSKAPFIVNSYGKSLLRVDRISGEKRGETFDIESEDPETTFVALETYGVVDSNNDSISVAEKRIIDAVDSIGQVFDYGWEYGISMSELRNTEDVLRELNEKHTGLGFYMKQMEDFFDENTQENAYLWSQRRADQMMSIKRRISSAINSGIDEVDLKKIDERSG